MKVKPLPTVVFPLYLFVLSPPLSLCQSVFNFMKDAQQKKLFPVVLAAPAALWCYVTIFEHFKKIISDTTNYMLNVQL